VPIFVGIKSMFEVLCNIVNAEGLQDWQIEALSMLR